MKLDENVLVKDKKLNLDAKNNIIIKKNICLIELYFVHLYYKLLNYGSI